MENESETQIEEPTNNTFESVEVSTQDETPTPTTEDTDTDIDYKSEYETTKESYDKLREEFNKGVPEEYKYENSIKEASLDILDEDGLKTFFEEAKEHRITQDTMDWLIKKQQETLALVAPAQETKEKNVLGELQYDWGDEFDKKLTATAKYAMANYPEPVWKHMQTNTDTVKWLYEQLEQNRGHNPIDSTEQPSKQPVTKGSLYELVKDPRYKLPAGDPAGEEYRAHVRQQFEYANKK
ncbi:hypothetical protein V5T82_14180 [Magnetovibrio sp. PR-2]|uniref:hypothetical protein n=1 Tax=Magnetovibrio sp. PR-2 TaxID=3120356 RepID=UPI002FCE0228